ncbi:MAG TPA: hypothetical protein VK511_06875 [Gemmatimonadaceae bacterium]|nr:hypothetical protein [Gemmatimonadaceae bacterium]
MRFLKLVQSAVPALLFAATAPAQSKPGISMDQTMNTITTSASRTDSVTGVMHMTSAGTNARIEIDSGRIVRNVGPFSPGPHAVMIMRDGASEMVYLNPDKKEYISIKPFQMMQGVQKMMESMGGSMKFDTSATHIGIDSLGPGPTIDGHPTVTYRLTMAMRMTMSMMGQSNVVETQSTQDIQAATDMASFVDLNAGPNRFAEFSQSMGMNKDLFDKMAATQRKVRGFPLRSVKHSTTSTNGVTRTTVETIETRNIKRVTVPDSAFAIPGDYKPVSMPAMPGAVP